MSAFKFPLPSQFYHHVRFVIICLFILACVCASNAQQRYSHNVFWFRAAFSDTITSRLKWDVWLQWRRQNSVDSKSNPFAEPQVRAYWTWLQYSVSKRFSVSVSPFCYFETHVLNVQPSDEQRPPVKEFRWLLRMDHQTPGRYLNLINRCNIEYRSRDLLNDGNYRQNWRIRYMLRLEKPVRNLLPRPVTFILFDEVFVHFGDAVKNNATAFDQNRLYGGFNYEILPNIRTTLGYIYTFQVRASGDEYDDVNTLWFVLTFDNVFSQFKASRLKKA
jgi:hypothetical protein